MDGKNLVIFLQEKFNEIERTIKEIETETEIREKLSDPKDLQDYMDNLDKLHMQMKCIKKFIENHICKSQRNF